MIYIYIFPINGFKRNVPDKKLINAYEKSKGVEKYTPEEFIAGINDESIDLNNNWARVIEDPDGFFPISCVHRDDLAFIGYDTSKVTDGDLETLAQKLGSDYCEQLFWSSLPIIADILGIPKIGEENEDDDDFDFDDDEDGKD